MTQQTLIIRQDQTLSTAGLTARDMFELKLRLEKPLRQPLLFDLRCDILQSVRRSSIFRHRCYHQQGRLHGLALAGHPPRHYMA
jgi:hypothetical protein